MGMARSKDELIIEQLKRDNKDLREENERARQANLDVMMHFEDMKAAKEKAEARVAELSELVSEAHDLFEGILDGSYEPDSFTSQPYKFALLEDSSRSWLLRRNAEAVEVAADKYGSIGDSPFRKELFLTLKDYAQRLRQQADEAERAGGEHG